LKSKKSKKPAPREQKKREKRHRIRAAARESFSKHGYDAATLRQIAKRAHVGLGTLFNYAQDKQDLIFFIFNEELSAVTDEALEAAHSQKRLLEQLAALIQPHFELYAKTPGLSRILLNHMTFYSEGMHATEFQQIRGRLFSGMEDLVRAAQQDGQIMSGEDATLIARHFFLVFAGALRWWIAGQKPDPRQGAAELKRLFELQMNGLRAAPAEETVSKAQIDNSAPLQ